MPAAAAGGACGGSASASNFINGSVSYNGDLNYSYCYDKGTYASLWTAYTLHFGQYVPTTTDYDSQFRSKYSRPRYVYASSSDSWRSNPDTNIPAADQVNVWSGSYGANFASGTYNEDTYKPVFMDGNTYARGHNIPGADRRNATGLEAQTYYATNSTPQIQDRFNGGIWSSIEEVVRYSACKDKNGYLYVVTGPAFRKGTTAQNTTYIHPANDSGKTVPVPNYYWKVILKVKTDSDGNVTRASGIGFWIAHKESSSSSWFDFLTSIDQIEAWTGLDLFHNLPDSVESTAEANSSWTTFTNF